MREAAFCCCICDMWGSQGREAEVYTASRNSSATGEHEVAGYVSLRWDNEARDWICVETGGVPAEARLRCHCCALAAPSPCLLAMDSVKLLT